jgi:predicted HicB family RNase H-like nuclease
MNLLKYKDYIAEIQIDQKAGLLAGTVLNMRDGIAFEGKTVEKVIQAFHAAVDRYLAYCEESGGVPDKPFSGRLPFRTTPERHHNIFIAARLAGAKSLNAWMDETLAEAAESVIRRHTQVGDDIAQGGAPQPSSPHPPIPDALSRMTPKGDPSFGEVLFSTPVSLLLPQKTQKKGRSSNRRSPIPDALSRMTREEGRSSAEGHAGGPPP